MKARIVVVFIGIAFLWGLLLARAAYLQFLPNERLNSLQARQFQTVVTLQSRRGSIVDINGRDLAMSTTTYSLYADPKLIDKKRATAKKISNILNLPYDSIYSKIKDSSKRFVWIQRQLGEEKHLAIKELNVRGLSFVEEWKRIYPNENMLSQVIGFLGSEGQGLEGLELSLESQLKGNTKKVSVKKDARGRPLVQDGMLFTENAEGSEVKLTVDGNAQYVLESELHRAIQEFGADSAVGVVLDAKTSAIRALATLPSFDLNLVAKVSPDRKRNKAVTDLFEPGSTLKTFVLATALRENLIQPNTKFFCENGSFKIGKRVIREADSNHRFGTITATEILAYSSNIGTTKVAMQLGDEKLAKGLADFGFGSKLGVELPGEAKGILQPLPWHDHLLGNISFGHGIAVTPLQIANAYAAIANGGVLNRPYIVESLRDTETGQVSPVQSMALRRVLSEEQAQKIKMMLVAATTDKGTGLNARVNGFVVAGKTGTAQKVLAQGRGYQNGAYISSFAGFIPASDPRFVIYIAVDSPRKAYYGAQVAAPVFSRVASYLVRKEGLTPQVLSEQNILPSPQAGQNVVSERSGQEKAIEKVSSYKTRLIESLTNRKQEIIVKSEDAEVVMGRAREQNFETVPNVESLSMREVLRTFQGSGVDVKFVGTGLAREVMPAPNSPMPSDRRITVILR